MVFERYALNYTRAFNQLDRDCWNYEDGCVLIGAEAMYNATGDEFYLQSIQSFVDRYISEEGAIRGYAMEEYNIDRIPSGRPLFLLYKKTGQLKYRTAIESLMQQLRTHPRTQSGNLWHKKIYPYQIWLDGLYMGMPFYLLYENEFGDGSRYEDAVLQFRNARKYLYDEKTGLYYHAYDEKKQLFWANKETGCSENFWSRALGWFLMAFADCWALLPQNEKALKEELLTLWKEALDGMLKYQDTESGLFYQLTALATAEGNYLETSSSAMVAYTIFKGIRTGALNEEEYRAKGEAILLGLATHKFEYDNGILRLNGMCMGAGLGPEGNLYRDGSIQYYLNEPVVPDEQKGAGVAMMAWAEYRMLNAQCPARPTAQPEIHIFNGEYRF